MRAASRGRLDYSELNHQDNLWVTKEILMLDELEREAWAEWEGIGRQLTTALLSASITDESAGAIKQYLDNQLNRAGQLLIPWAQWAITPEEKQQARVEQVTAAKGDYERAFGALTSVKMKEAERRAQIYLLSVRIARRARRENRRLTKKQASWVVDAREAQQGGRAAWQRVSRMSAQDVVTLFEKELDKRDVKSDIRLELGDIL